MRERRCCINCKAYAAMNGGTRDSLVIIYEIERSDQVFVVGAIKAPLKMAGFEASV
jgi:hypothetical protein